MRKLSSVVALVLLFSMGAQAAPSIELDAIIPIVETEEDLPEPSEDSPIIVGTEEGDYYYLVEEDDGELVYIAEDDVPLAGLPQELMFEQKLPSKWELIWKRLMKLPAWIRKIVIDFLRNKGYNIPIEE